MDAELERIVLAAGQAPSGDNTQPWRFTVDPAARLVTPHLDESRDRSPMNAGQRMARIALGAAIENLVRAAGDFGWTAEAEHGRGASAAAVHFSGRGGAPGKACELIRARVTNRRVFDGKAIPTDRVGRLALEVQEFNGVSTHWIVAKDRISALAQVIGRADATMFGEPSMRRAFLANVRFDQPPGAEVAEGLSLDSLELSSSDRRALRMMPKIPDWLLNVTGATRVFAAKARELVASASGLCLIVARDRTPQADLDVGRVMQRAWLALTEQGLAVQPMSSMPVLENAVENGTPELVAALGAGKVKSLGDEFRSLAPELGGGRLTFMLRFGFAPAPSGRTGRLPLAAIMSSTATASPPRPAFP
ncbi:MAG TPA: hypothetical protein VGY53_01035 [Isosphaeraceae bacterium]|nr:hypothetical protein [Isosphaeraceae bacterium]